MASIKYSAELDTTKLDKSIKDSNKTIGDYAKKVEKAGGEMDRAFDKSTKNLKEAIVTQKALIKELENDVKNLEKAYKNMTPGAEAQKAARTLADTKAYLSQEQERLIQLQHEQIQVNKEEEASANSLQGMIGKWALSLGGAAAALGVLKKAFGETTQGMNAFNTVGAITQQILHDIVSGAGLSMSRIRESVIIQQQLNALREEEYLSAFRAAKYNNEYQKLYAQSIDKALSNEERLQKVNDALDNHNKAIDEQTDAIRKRLQETEKAFSIRPSSEKLKKEISQLYIELENLDAQRVSSTKRLLGIRSTLIKEQTEKELDRRKMIDDWLKAIEEEQIEREERETKVLKELRDEIAAGRLEGKDKELLILEQKYKEDLELYKGNEAIKLALTEKYAQDRYTIEMKYLDKVKAENAKMTAAMLKIDPGKGFSMLNRTLGDKAIDVSGMKGLAKGSAAWADKMSEEITENTNKSLKQQIELRRQVLDEAILFTHELAGQLNLTQEEQEAIDGMLGIISQLAMGNYIGAAMGILSKIMGVFGQMREVVSEPVWRKQIEAWDALIERQERVIELSERTGGTEKALRDAVKLAQKEFDIIDAARQEWRERSRGERNEELDEAYREAKDKLEDAERALKDFLAGGATENTIADAIAEGFASGKTSVDDFAEYMNDILTEAVLEVFKTSLTGEAMTELQEYISEALSDKILTAEEKAEIDRRVKVIADNNKELWDDLSGALNMGESPTTGMMGIARQLTEETGAELAGLWRRSADDQRQMRDYTKEGVSHLVAIEHNTYNTVEELRVAVNELRDINSNTKPVYSGDM